MFGTLSFQEKVMCNSLGYRKSIDYGEVGHADRDSGRLVRVNEGRMILLHSDNLRLRIVSGRKTREELASSRHSPQSCPKAVVTHITRPEDEVDFQVMDLVRL
jgi:hypothetical protein